MGLHAPPGEFNEVFNDVRVLLNNDALLKDGASSAFSQYNKDQLTPVKVDGSELLGLVTDHNDLGSGRFADPRSQQSFKYDHLRKEASDYKPWSPDSEVESLRAAIEAEVTAYALNHYRHGVSATFSKPTEGGKSIVCCIEDHQFQPKNYWNGRWRSQWTVTIAGQQAEVVGVLKVQVILPLPPFLTTSLHRTLSRCTTTRTATCSLCHPRRRRKASHLAMMLRQPKNWSSSWRNQRQSIRLPLAKTTRQCRTQQGAEASASRHSDKDRLEQ